MEETSEGNAEVKSLLALLASERLLVEQFKSNFLQLKQEYESQSKETERLQSISAMLQSERDVAQRQLEETTSKIAAEFNQKDDILRYTQQKLAETEERLRTLRRDKEVNERELYRRLEESRQLLEVTKTKLFQLQSDSAVLHNAVEEIQERNKKEKRKLAVELETTVQRLNAEKENLLTELNSVSSRTIKKINQMQQKNNLLEITIQKLHETVNELTTQKSSLSLELENLKTQTSQQTGEWTTKLQHYQANEVKLTAKLESAELNLQEVLKQKTLAEAKNTSLEKSLLDLQERLRETERNAERRVAKAQEETEKIKNNLQMEIDFLHDKIRSVQRELDYERNSSSQVAERLRLREKDLDILHLNLQKEEAGNLKALNQSENLLESKYRDSLNEKTVQLAEASAKVLELSSRLNFIENLNKKLEEDNSSLKCELFEKIKLLSSTENLRQKVEELENEWETCDKIKRENQELKNQIFAQKNEMENKFVKQERELLDEISNLKSQLAGKDVVEEKLKKDFEKEREKSKTYSKLIWKLRHKLAACGTETTTTGDQQQTEFREI